MAGSSAARKGQGRSQMQSGKRPKGGGRQELVQHPHTNAYAGQGQYGGGTSGYAQKRGKQMYGGPVRMKASEQKVFALAKSEGISPEDARARLREEQERAREQKESARFDAQTAGMGSEDKQCVRELMGRSYTLKGAVAEVKRPRWRW